MDKELTKLLKELAGLPKAADEEIEFGRKLFRAAMPRIGQRPIGDWLYCEEWEDALVPIRLPKGMADELKRMDEAKEEAQLGRCKGCESKTTCPTIERNPSEILLTYLIKHAFSEILSIMLGQGSIE